MPSQKPALLPTLIAFIAGCMTATAGPAWGQVQEAAARPVSAAAGPQDPAELEAFVDGVMAAQKPAHHTVGATIAVVRDGKLLFAKGYGYADFAKQRPVEPDRTLFRIASVSKLFVWTAVMQLVEQGKLDLNADVNRYLTEFKIPATFPQPITMTHLMTHTPGFEDRATGLFAHSPDRLTPLGVLLATDMPARVRPPGEFAAYSNYGTALAGYIVEQVSGMRWEDYLERNLLQPLEMNHTTVRQPLSGQLLNDLAVGYKYQDGDYKEQGFEFVPLHPAGAMSATATDMARFMIAHLRGGRYASARILSERATQEMHTRIFTHDERLNGMLHGFHEMDSHGQRIFGHGGDTLWFHSQLALFPEQQLGVFVSYNSDTGARARSQLLDAFLDHYFPEPPPHPAQATEEVRERARQLAGTYVSLRVAHSTIEKLGQLFMVRRVRASDDGQLVTSGLGSDPQRWIEVEPLRFQEIDGTNRMLFRKDPSGRTYAFTNSFPAVGFVKMSPDETPLFQFAAVGLCALVLCITFILQPIRTFQNRRKGVRHPARARMARLLGWLVSALAVTFLVGFSVAMADPTAIVFGIPPLLRDLIALPIVMTPLIVAVIAMTAIAWKNSYWTLAGRIRYTFVALAGMGLLAWLYHWNMLGWHLH